MNKYYQGNLVNIIKRFRQKDKDGMILYTENKTNMKKLKLRKKGFLDYKTRRLVTRRREEVLRAKKGSFLGLKKGSFIKNKIRLYMATLK